MNDAQHDSAPEASESHSKPSKPKQKKAGAGLTVVLVIVLALVVIVVLDRFAGINIFTTEEKRAQEKVESFLADSGDWHAVFLTNGQVYFGQLSNPDAQFAYLQDVYYLQLQQVQPAEVEGGTGEGAQVVPAAAGQQLTLIKFGTELHGPRDFMQINRDHILFWEELKGESSVVQAIAQYKEGQEN